MWNSVPDAAGHSSWIDECPIKIDAGWRIDLSGARAENMTLETKLAKYLAWSAKNPGPYVTWQVALEDRLLQDDAVFVDTKLHLGGQAILASVLLPVARVPEIQRKYARGSGSRIN